LFDLRIERPEIYAISHPDLLGWFTDIENEDYHELPGVSKSGTDKIHKSINHWLNPEHKDYSHLTFGTAVHTAILEPDTWDSLYVKGPPGVDKRHKDYKSAKTEAGNNGKILLDPTQWDNVSYAWESVFAHPIAAEWFNNKAAIAEGSLWVEEENTGILAKCRPDWLMLDEGLCVDLKTTKNASPDPDGVGGGFPRSCGQYRYDVAAAWYTDMLTTHFEKPFDMPFVAVESSPPFNTCVYRIDPDSVQRARLAYMQDLARLIEFVEQPDAEGGYSDTVEVIQIPKYFRR
jgi:exodeoxyribonuclease VIII